ncbi:hypothetical protein [Rhodanobacter denitrificans]|uniref:Uncharacterized protein n=1 Tax=Rhodanobacter denitrificans TaxID=666685 RepID=M4NEC2_9GAMM|nr:hypothetical protein [Rhodanobacter denitrificans]AGG89094.1 hypothetical protein R2APBS1_1971 [Rhodanobacter denitrificans]UJJ53121.1 hypothetical protein LRK52_18620 [Rhodanobacter denitrificans]
MLFGDGPRPHVTCSQDLALAYSDFLGLLNILITLGRDASFRIAGNDDDAALMGFSVYMDDALVLVLQPAGTILPDGDSSSCQAPFDSFERMAPVLLEAMAKRSGFTAKDAEAFQYSIVALAFSRDVDEAIIEEAYSEDLVKGQYAPNLVAKAWKHLTSARTMVEMTATVSGR